MRPLTLFATLTLSTCLAAPVLAAAPQLGAFGFDAAGMDRSVKPGDDFYGYANGSWVKTTAIPADRSSVDAFVTLDELSRARTRGIIEAAAAAGTSGDADARRVGTYYATFMDEAAIEAKGVAAIQPALDRIAAIATKSDLARVLGADQRIGVSGPFRVGVEQDAKNPEHYMVGMGQSGLGMPDRDYYLVDTAKFADTRAKYIAHIAAMFRLAGLTDADARAKAVFALERDIAQAHWTQVENRDPVKTYNLRSPAALAAEAPGFDWAAFGDAAGVGHEERLDIAQPTAFTATARLVADRPLAVWKDYLAYRVLNAEAGVLSKAFVDEDFAFYGTVLSDQPENEVRWKRGVDAVNGAMGEAVGKLYVAKYFPPEAKAKIDALVHDLLTSMGASITAASWMSPATKTQALAKLATFDPKLGYPSKWRDYSKLIVVAGDAVGNNDRANAFEYDRNLAKLGGPLDRTEWGMTPQTINAYYNPPKNEIVFPAAIMQPPFFDPAADPAVNYGAIGAVIGHEISHGFDDEGRQFDGARTRSRDWWTAADATAKFVAQCQAARRAIQRLRARLPGSHVNGDLTTGREHRGPGRYPA